MKLRNKKTGEIGVINLKVYGDETEYVYDTVETLYKEWEDITPKDPLIKDKDLRDIIRLWAKYHNIVTLRYKKLNDIFGCYYLIDTQGYFSIDVDIDYLKIGKAYTITELCGSKE